MVQILQTNGRNAREAMKPWYVKRGDRFYIRDVDLQAFDKHLSEEYQPEYSSWQNTNNGLMAEHMMYSRGYVDFPKKFKDLKSPDGVPTEIKTYGEHRDADAHQQNVLHNGYDGPKGRVASLWERKVLLKKYIDNRVIFMVRYDEYYEVDGLFEWNDQIQRYEEVEGDEERV